jgi:hypothetical protein
VPIYVHQCQVCGFAQADIFSLGAPNPKCCGKRTKRRMPTRVVGRVAPDSNGVHTGSGFAAPTPAAFEPEAATWRPENRGVNKEVVRDNPNQIRPPETTGAFAKDYDACDAQERDARWRDSVEATSAWLTHEGEKAGMAPRKARDEANTIAQETITKARETNERGDGLS